jgi:capsular exopolysaccharide synthesis family protein
MDLPLLVAAARRHLVLLLASVALGAPAGWAFLSVSTPLYRSSSAVLFSLDQGSSVSELAEGTALVQNLAPSYVIVATAPLVLDPVIHRLQLPYGATQLARRVTATLDQGGLIMELDVEDQVPDRATAIAQAVAEQVVRTVPQLSARAAGQAEITATMIPGSVTAAVRSSPAPITGLVAGGVLGPVLAALAVMLLEMAILSPPVLDRRTAARTVAAPVLAAVPHDPLAHSVPLPVSTHPYLVRAESYRLLQTAVDLVHDPSEPLALVVCAPGKGDGTTATAVNLAVSLSMAGRRVLLVDADLRRPQVGELLGFSSGPGLTDVLQAAAPWRDQIRTWPAFPAARHPLDVLTAGPVTDGVSDLVASAEMTSMLNQARTQYDVMVIDCPDLASSTDAAAVAAKADKVVLVLDVRTARARRVTDAVERLRMAGGRIQGVVLNRTARHHDMGRSS